MKNIAIGVLAVLLVSIFLQPLTEVANVMREKIILGSALSNACRAAKDRSLIYEEQRDRDAEIDEQLFKEYFAEAFESAMNLTENLTSGSTMKFTSNDGKYNSFEVELDISTDENDEGQRITEVTVTAKSLYKFKTKYLKAISGSADYSLVCTRNLMLRVKN